MKSIKKYFLFGVLSLTLAALGSSCKAKEGCSNTERYAVKTDKEGNMSSKRGKSNLLSKKQRKKKSR